MKILFSRLRSTAGLVPLLWILHAAPSVAQVEIAKRVVGSGGATMGSVNYSVAGTAGQVAIGSPGGGNFAALSGYWVVEDNVATGVGYVPGVPIALALDQNFPNPFNPATTIPFALPRESMVKLEVFDLAGRRVDELIHELRPAGLHRVTYAPSSLASGIYVFRLETDGQVKTRRFVLLK